MAVFRHRRADWTSAASDADISIPPTNHDPRFISRNSCSSVSDPGLRISIQLDLRWGDVQKHHDVARTRATGHVRGESSGRPAVRPQGRGGLNGTDLELERDH